ncbi:MAG: phosphoglycerate dehydrogenase [Crocinitomicaceae bacterium]|jgi:D-3-phosphoglycerate dehydrogenase|nr:phosphoglycerate dehydrogenase [Crocinitomicaceae bacterium]
MKILFIDTVHEILEHRLKAAGFDCIDGTKLNMEECKAILPEIEGIIIRARFTMDEDLLRFAPRLKFIARSGAGMENIDEAYCKERKIRLFNAPEGNRNAVGEQALGMLLSLLNKIHTANRDVKLGKWEREHNRGLELDGKTVGIIGFGNNGSSFAKKLQGFDVRVLAYDKYKSGFTSGQVEEARLEDIFREADVVSFHIPQNEETIYMANSAFFDAFQKPVFLLNLSRGKIVETGALLHAIKSGKVLGAGLDVLEYEKSSFEHFFDGSLPDEFTELVQREEVLLTPHVGGWSTESYFKLSDVLADKILAAYATTN